MHVSIHDYAYRIYSVISLGLPCSTADNKTTKRAREIHARIITSDLVGISIPPWQELTRRDSKVTRSIFDHISSTELNTFATAILKDETPLLLRARGAMMSMAVADGIGHNFEFTDVTDKPGSRCLVYPSKTPGVTFETHTISLVWYLASGPTTRPWVCASPTRCFRVGIITAPTCARGSGAGGTKA